MAESYDVTAQRQTTNMMPDGRFGDVVEITFVTKPSGIVLRQDVPVSQYSNVETVRELLADRAAQAEAIHKL